MLEIAFDGHEQWPVPDIRLIILRCANEADAHIVADWVKKGHKPGIFINVWPDEVLAFDSWADDHNYHVKPGHWTVWWYD